MLLERELDTWGFAHLSFQEYLCADEWASQPANAPRDWGSRVAESWWREALLLYASRAADASPLVTAALDHGSPQALALAMQLAGEKLNLDVATRDRVERAMVEAFASRDEEKFRHAGAAWLLRQQAANYHRLNETAEISGWVTQAEFQTFLRSDLVARNPFGHVPANWNQGWFQGGPKDPVLGVSARMALAYVRWLDESFPTFNHRLPHPVECEDGPTWLTWCDDGGSYSLNGECPPKIEARMSAWHQARPDLDGKADARDFEFALDFHRFFGFGTDRSLDRGRGLAHPLARALDIDLVHVRGLDRDLGFAFQHTLDSALIVRDPDPDRRRVSNATAPSPAASPKPSTSLSDCLV